LPFQIPKLAPTGVAASAVSGRVSQRFQCAPRDPFDSSVTSLARRRAVQPSRVLRSSRPGSFFTSDRVLKIMVSPLAAVKAGHSGRPAWEEPPPEKAEIRTRRG